jgi:TPR repeat protein
MYENGRGVKQDYREAVQWYRKAADHGDAAAQFNLGTLYANGRGVAVDYVEAYHWLSLASSRFAASDEQRTRAIQNCTLVASMMTGAQIAEAQKRANAWNPI